MTPGTEPPAAPARPSRIGPAALGLTSATTAAAAAATAAAVTGTVFEIIDAGRPVPGLAGGVVIAALAGLAGTWQRSPIAMTTAVVGLCALYHALGYPGMAPGVALFVAVYALTAQGSGARSLALSVVAIAAVNALPLLPPNPVGFGWAIAGPAVAMITAAALGEAARARRLAVDEQLRALRQAGEQDLQRRLAEDRLALAHEVHDILAHTVTVIAVQAAAADEALDSRPDDARAALSAVRDAAREAMTELRGTLAMLRAAPAPTDPPPGSASIDQLEQLVDRAGAAGLQVTLTRTGTGALAPVVDRTVYRIVQEALTNTLRHAAAAHAAVNVEIDDQQVRVEITDDGTPPTPAPDGSAGTGHGLRGMTERTTALGGTLRAGPRAGGGYRVLAHIPTTPTSPAWTTPRADPSPAR